MKIETLNKVIESGKIKMDDFSQLLELDPKELQEILQKIGVDDVQSAIALIREDSFPSKEFIDQLRLMMQN